MIESVTHSESAAKPMLDLAQLTQARQQASARKISVVKVLEDEGGFSPYDLMLELGRLLHMPVLKMEELHTL